MNTHVFQAHSMASAVAQVKARLGPDALILGTRTVREGGLFSLSRRKLVEITAAGESGSEPVGQPATASRLPLPSMDVPSWLQRDKPAGSRRFAGRDMALLSERLSLKPSAGDSSSAHLPRRLRSLFESFVSADISESLARQLLRDLPGDLDPSSASDSNPLLGRIEKLIPTVGAIQPGLAGKPQIVSFVGPTGVGKTTTIAKLAAQYKL